MHGTLPPLKSAVHIVGPSVKAFECEQPTSPPGALQIADQAMQRAGQRIIAAKQLSPDIPQIDLAIVRSMQGGIYMNLVSGTLSQCGTSLMITEYDGFSEA